MQEANMISMMYTPTSRTWSWRNWSFKLDFRDKRASLAVDTPGLKAFGLDEVRAEFYWASQSMGAGLTIGEDFEECVRFRACLPPFSFYVGSQGHLGERILHGLKALPAKGEKDWYPGDDRSVGFR